MRRKYRAFISYAHTDAKFAAWLHKALENFRLPRNLAVEAGKFPFKPVFRDRDDLRSSPNLGATINEALRDSNALIVVCSDAAVASQWVNEEIRLFREQHGVARVFAIVADGEPPGCFPPALVAGGYEPVAADARATQGGQSDALLKLAAGLLELDLDTLKRRDLRRRQVRMSWIAGVSMALALAMLGLTLAAMDARDKAERHRAQAEDLIAFMLGDLRQRLEPVGRLDVLDQVGEKAMNYFGAFSSRELSEQATLQRAKAIRQIGEVRKAQGQLGEAAESFQESLRILESAHERHPVEPAVLFELGQAYFWVADIYYSANDFTAARQWIVQYRDVARALTELRPDNSAYQLEHAYSASNLAALDYQVGNYGSALTGFQESADIVAALLEDNSEDELLIYELAGSISWVGSAYAALHRLSEALAAHERQLGLMRSIATAADKRTQRSLADALSLVAHDQYRLGYTRKAVGLMREAVDLYAALVAHDPDNARWRAALFSAQTMLARNYMAGEMFDAAEFELRSAEAGLKTLLEETTSDADLQDYWITNQLIRANLLLAKKRQSEATALLRSAIERLEEQRGGTRSETTDRLYAAAGYVLGQALFEEGELEAAFMVTQRTLDTISTLDDSDIELYATVFALRSQLEEETDDQRQYLDRVGFLQPALWPMTPAARALRRSP